MRRGIWERGPRGLLLAFLDSDDIWLPNKLADHVAELETQPEAGLVSAPMLYCYEWNPEGNPGLRDHILEYAPGDGFIRPHRSLRRVVRLGRTARCVRAASSSGARRLSGSAASTRNSIGGRFSCTKTLPFLSKMYLNVPVYVSSECRDRNRCSPYSMTRQQSSVQQEEAARRFYFQWLRDYVKSSGVHDVQVLRALSRESWYYDLPLPVAGFCRRVQDKWRGLVSCRSRG